MQAAEQYVQCDLIQKKKIKEIHSKNCIFL